jgi:hypothetical protein
MEKSRKHLMKIHRFLLTAFLLRGLMAYAGEVAVARDDNDAVRDSRWRTYKGNELNFSFFGVGTDRKFEHDGLGGGLSYFFSRYAGVEGYAYSESLSDHLVDNVGGSLFLRLPIRKSGVALYALGGGGRQFDPFKQWTVDAGGGLEWRFLDHVGLFADARSVWPVRTHHPYPMGRLGLRVGF